MIIFCTFISPWLLLNSFIILFLISTQFWKYCLKRFERIRELNALVGITIAVIIFESSHKTFSYSPYVPDKFTLNFIPTWKDILSKYPSHIPSFYCSQAEYLSEFKEATWRIGRRGLHSEFEYHLIPRYISTSSIFYQINHLHVLRNLLIDSILDSEQSGQGNFLLDRIETLPYRVLSWWI